MVATRILSLLLAVCLMTGTLLPFGSVHAAADSQVDCENGPAEDAPDTTEQIVEEISDAITQES